MTGRAGAAGPGYVPGYWLNETGQVLRPAVWAYLRGEPLEPAQLAAIRAYLRQWIGADFRGRLVDELRRQVDAIGSERELTAWLELALEAGIDPL